MNSGRPASLDDEARGENARPQSSASSMEWTLGGFRGFLSALHLPVDRAPVFVVFRLVVVLLSQQLLQKTHLHLMTKLYGSTCVHLLRRVLPPIRSLKMALIWPTDRAIFASKISGEL